MTGSPDVRLTETRRAGPEAEPDPRGQLARLVWVAPALLTLAITSAGLNRAQPWRDELATWSAATRPLGDLVRLAGTIDATSGPYYLLMHGWLTFFGDSVTALRAPAVLAMSGAAGLTAVLGERLLGARAGLLAGLLFAVLPGTSRYGQEARPYAFATFLAVLATVLLVGALRRPGWARWAGYAAVVAALGLAHLIALALLTGHAVAVLLAWRSGRDPRLWRWPLALLPVVLVLAPLVLVARDQRSRQLDWVDPARLSDLAALPGGVMQSGVVGGLVLGLAALGTAGLGRRGLLLGSCALLPVLLVFAAGVLVPLWVPRYLVFTVPFVCLLAGAMLALVPSPSALALVVLAALLGLPEQNALRRTHEWPRSAAVDYRAAARIIGANQRPGDAIVYHPRTGWLFLDLATAYHLRSDPPRDVLLVHDQVQRADLWASECDRPAQCLAGVDRVWLLVAGKRADPLPAAPEPKAAALRDAFTVNRVWQLPGLTVALLSRPG